MSFGKDLIRSLRITAPAALGALVVLATAAAAAETPSPALLVLNKEGTLAIVDPASGKLVAKVPVGESPHEVAASADGKLAFVTNYGSQTPGRSLSVIDLAGQKELQRVDLGVLRKPHGVTFFDGKVYFTAETNKLIGRYDPAANQVDWLLGTGQNTTHMVLGNKANNQLYTSNIGSDSITIIDPSTNETVIPVCKGPEGFDLSPDGKEIWAACSRDGGVAVIDVANKRVTHTFNVQTKRSNRLHFTPDSRLVLISDLEAGDLVILERATKKELKRIKLGRQPAGILIPPDGSVAYVGVTGDNNVAVIDLRTFDLKSRLSTGTGPDGMAWAVR